MIDKYNIIYNSLHTLNKNTKTFILIEPYGATLSLLKRGIANGYNIIILTANSDLRIIPDAIVKLSSLCINIDTHDEDRLISCVTDLQHIISIN